MEILEQTFKEVFVDQDGNIRNSIDFNRAKIKEAMTLYAERKLKENFYEPRWVNVDDFLPQIGNWYIVIERNQVNFLFYDSYGIWLSSISEKDGEDCEWNHKITHWMELPTPPSA